MVVYFQVRNQVLVAPMGQVIDINLQAVEIAVNRRRSEDPDKLFWSVVGLARHFIREANKDKAEE